MMNTAIAISGFVKKFKAARTEEEKAVAILDLVQQNQSQTKDKSLKEIALQDLATRADIYVLKADINALKIDLAETKIFFIKWVASGIILVGIWAAAIVASMVKYIA